MSYFECLFEQFLQIMKEKKLQHLFLIFVLTMIFLLFSIILLINYNVVKYFKKINSTGTIIITWNSEYNEEITSKLEKLKEKYKILQIKIFSPKNALSILLKGEELTSIDLSKIYQVLPYTAVISCREDKKNLLDIKQFLKKQPGIKNIIVDLSKIEIINSIRSNYNYFLIIILLMLLLACGALSFSYSYILKLSKAKELYILKSVGASNSFIIIPFILKGLLSGILASAFGLFLTKLLIIYLNTLFNTPPIWIKIEMIPISYCLFITIGIVLISCMGSLLAVNPLFKKGV